MQARNRSPARFIVEGYSSAFKCNVVWKIEVSGRGISARRETDGRSISISWRQLLGAALVYGLDSDRQGDKKL